VVPHPIDEPGAAACQTCHEHGATIAGLVAPAMSHPPRGSCVQCHVAAAAPGAASPATSFAGRRPARGERAWIGAPPTIPHATWMRERCESCHGPLGALGMRSTHPWRTSCEQCHAPSAVLDQRAPRPIGGTP